MVDSSIRWEESSDNECDSDTDRDESLRGNTFYDSGGFAYRLARANPCVNACAALARKSLPVC